MKTAYKIVLLSGLISVSCLQAQTRTSVANGDWFNPATWSPAGVPSPTDNVLIINTDVTFSQNILITPQSLFKVNPGKSLVNTTGQDSLIFGTAVFNNEGYISAGFFTGEAEDTMYNSGAMNITNDFFQSGITWNKSTGSICCGQIFSIGQDMINDGSIKSTMLINADNGTGTGGRFCVSGSLLNTGVFSGTIDVCDATPNQFNDINGTMTLTVTTCSAGPCSTCLPNSIAQHQQPVLTIGLTPNPFTAVLQLSIENAKGKIKIQLFDYSGKCVLSDSFNNNSYSIERNNLPAGMYFIMIEDAEGNVVSAKVIAE